MATTSHHDADVAPELAGLNLADKPDGPGAAAMIAAGIGIFMTGLFTVLNELSEGINKFLDAFDGDIGVGPLSGKTIMGTIGFFGSWLILGMAWKNKNIDIKKMFWVGVALGLAGAILMFPPVFLAFHE